MYHIKIAE
jgi:hypothetical protein